MNNVKTKTLLTTLLLATAIGCGEPETLTTSNCIYKPTGMCERMDDGAVVWSTFPQTPVRFSDNDKALLWRVGLATCEDCLGQTDNWNCDKHNVEVACKELQ
jgi:hypothetical protein